MRREGYPNLGPNQLGVFEAGYGKEAREAKKGKKAMVAKEAKEAKETTKPRKPLKGRGIQEATKRLP